MSRLNRSRTRRVASPDADALRPALEMVLRPEGSPPIALGFRLPPIPGIPDAYSQLSAGLNVAAENSCFSEIPQDEVKATLAALSDAYVRSCYHKLRFDDCLTIAKLRRAALGGPVVSDWASIPALVWEASAFLGAVRTALDILVYLSARRAGKSESAAESWEANEAVSPRAREGGSPPTRYDVPEVLIIRAQNPWFTRLNVYRNVVFHRGLTNDKWGYYSKADTAEEASDPRFNAMLIPDECSLDDRKRAHHWTYGDRNRLDDLVDEIYAGFEKVLLETLTTAWGGALPAPGTIPKHEQSNTLLRLPQPAALEYLDCKAVPIFETKLAAKAFREIPTEELTLRAVRPTRIGDNPPSFLLAVYDSANSLPWKVHLYGLVNGSLVRKQTLDADPSQGIVPGIISICASGDAISTFFVWQSPNRV